MHPVEANDYVIASSPIEEWANWCKATVESSGPGKATIGGNRVGKTWATKYLLIHKNTFLGSDLPCIVLPQRFYTNPTPKKFFSHFLTVAGHGLVRGDEDTLRERLLEILIDIPSKMQFPRIVLIIDEAQWLWLLHYRLIINVANELCEKGVRLIVLLVGHAELEATVKRYIAMKQRHIVGRFMGEVFGFRGIESSAELARVFFQYDERAFFPEGSDVSYTRAFAGDRFGRGLRLALMAPAVWDAMAAVRIAAGKNGPISVPMQTVTRLANELLMRVVGDLEAPFILEESQWFEILREVGFLELQD